VLTWISQPIAKVVLHFTSTPIDGNGSTACVVAFPSSFGLAKIAAEDFMSGALGDIDHGLGAPPHKVCLSFLLWIDSYARHNGPPLELHDKT
jgi:hypothetical protein